jgi:hypothetical protein
MVTRPGVCLLPVHNHLITVHTTREDLIKNMAYSDIPYAVRAKRRFNSAYISLASIMLTRSVTWVSGMLIITGFLCVDTSNMAVPLFVYSMVGSIDFIYFSSSPAILAKFSDVGKIKREDVAGVVVASLTVARATFPSDIRGECSYPTWTAIPVKGGAVVSWYRWGRLCRGQPRRAAH